MLFVDLEISEMKLEDEAHFLGVSMTTCFYMRHKLYHAATEIINNQILSGEIEVDTQYLSINLKGTKPHEMPRYSKKRGGQFAFRGISHHKISVVCAVDEDDHMIMNITGLGSESFEKYIKMKCILTMSKKSYLIQSQVYSSLQIILEQPTIKSQHHQQKRNT